jgi:crotonobetainyl-CoA:carnitine CoA-transferase CaiB-like acyl-CoA transferase
MAGPLHGVRVLEVAQVYAVPAAGSLLSDMGAIVTKVEPPWGDSSRYGRPFLPGEGRNYIGINHGKRTICLDLGKAEAREVVDRLIAESDVMLVSLREEQILRYGLEYERCAGLRPGLIYAVNTALGPDGPLAGLGGYDMTITALSGMGSVLGRVENGQLVLASGVAVSDAATGFLLVAGVSAALFHRALTGEGQRIETSNLSSSLNCQLPGLNWFASTDPPLMERFHRRVQELQAEGADFGAMQVARRDLLGRPDGGNVYYRAYRTRDGYISVGAISPDLALRFRSATGIDDPRQRPSAAAGVQEQREYLARMVEQAEAVFASRTTDEWTAVLTEHRVPNARVNFPEEAIEDPQVIANGYVTELEHELLGAFKKPSPPLRMSVTPLAISAPAAPLDRHTDEVLHELGYGDEQIAGLRAAGAAGRAAELTTEYH